MSIKLAYLALSLVLLSFCCLEIFSQDKLPSTNQVLSPPLQEPNNADKTTEKPTLPTINNPRIVIRKQERKLELFDGEKLIKTYHVALGFTPQGDKEQEGDGKTPEGEFFIFTKNDQSKFYLSLGISYPGIDDAERGLKSNLISQDEYNAIVEAVNAKKMPPQQTALGGEIYIHGGGIENDWTQGCVGLDNNEIKELFEAVTVGTKVTILP